MLQCFVTNHNMRVQHQKPCGWIRDLLQNTFDHSALKPLYLTTIPTAFRASFSAEYNILLTPRPFWEFMWAFASEIL